MSVNIAGRAGRWSAEHRKTAVLAWLAFCIAAIALGTVAGTKMLKQADTAAGGTQDGGADPEAGGLPGPGGRERAGRSRGRRRSADPRFRATVADVVRTVSALPQVERVRSPLAAANSGQLSHDGRSALVQFDMKGDQDKADKKVQPVLDAVDARPGPPPRRSRWPSSGSRARPTS